MNFIGTLQFSCPVYTRLEVASRISLHNWSFKVTTQVCEGFRVNQSWIYYWNSFDWMAIVYTIRVCYYYSNGTTRRDPYMEELLLREGES